MMDCNKVIKDIEYAKDLLQNRPEQDTVDYKVYEVLDDALDLIHDLRSQIAMLVGTQHVMAKIMDEKQNRINIEQTLDETYGVTGGLCPTCGNWIQSAHSFCGFCGQPIGWEKKKTNGFHTHTEATHNGHNLHNVQGCASDLKAQVTK